MVVMQNCLGKNKCNLYALSRLKIFFIIDVINKMNIVQSFFISCKFNGVKLNSYDNKTVGFVVISISIFSYQCAKVIVFHVFVQITKLSPFLKEQYFKI